MVKKKKEVPKKKEKKEKVKKGYEDVTDEDLTNLEKDLELRTAFVKMKHELMMDELRFSRDSNTIKHEQDMERQRIKSAEIRKAQMRRQGGDAYN